MRTSSQSADAHYLGHRERLRERFMKAGGKAFADYELLELVLFRAIPRRDVKALAKMLLARFGSFAEVAAARPERLKEIDGLGAAAIVELKIVAEAAKRFAKIKMEKRSSMGSFRYYVATATRTWGRSDLPLANAKDPNRRNAAS